MSSKSETAAVATPYSQLGGADAVRAVVDRFYDLMDSLPATRSLRAIHPDDLSDSRDKLFYFLSGWLGGPNLYVERFGPPYLRARHLPFSIGIAERDQWMLCMRQALDETDIDAALRTKLVDALQALANHMRNRAESPVDETQAAL